jgi:threonine/homoserine/homoserine lactone efflux protein
MILSLIYQGLIIVLLLTFSFGPAFFSLINTAIKYGYKPSSLLAIGVVASDFFLCILVCLLVYFGAVNLLHSEKAQTFSAIIGGVILIVFGAFYFKKHVTKSDKSIDIGYIAPHPMLMVLKGFLINLFNPAVWFLWLGNVTAISKTLEYSLVNMILFFSVVLAAVLFVELAKISLAEKIKIYLTDKLMTIINYITGTVLIIFGFVLIYNHFFGK